MKENKSNQRQQPSKDERLRQEELKTKQLQVLLTGLAAIISAAMPAILKLMGG